jgi:hypothetical protein
MRRIEGSIWHIVIKAVKENILSKGPVANAVPEWAVTPWKKQEIKREEISRDSGAYASQPFSTDPAGGKLCARGNEYSLRNISADTPGGHLSSSSYSDTRSGAGWR